MTSVYLGTPAFEASRSQRTQARVFLVMGALGVAIGLVASFFALPYLVDGVETTALVHEIAGAGTSRKATVQFVTGDGKAATATLTAGNRVLHERMPIVYLPGSPEEAVFHRADPFKPSVVFGGSGFLLGALGLGILVRELRGRRSRERIARAPARFAGVVVGNVAVRSTDHRATVEGVDPSGRRVSGQGPSTLNPMPHGSPVTFVMERDPPHAYFVELSGPALR